jgi:hypothetical protein
VVRVQQLAAVVAQRVARAAQHDGHDARRAGRVQYPVRVAHEPPGRAQQRARRQVLRACRAGKSRRWLSSGRASPHERARAIGSSRPRRNGRVAVVPPGRVHAPVRAAILREICPNERERGGAERPALRREVHRGPSRLAIATALSLGERRVV